MDINLTLLGQMITFAIFVGFTMRYVWPPLREVMEARRKKIADGLAAAHQGEKALEAARIEVKQSLSEAKKEAARILDQANARAKHIVDAARNEAKEEAQRLLTLAQGDIEQEYHVAKNQLLEEMSGLTMLAVERVLKREVSQRDHDRLIDELVDHYTHAA